MTCECKKEMPEPERAGLCIYCCPTETWWRRYTACYVFRCSCPSMLTDPPEWAFGNTRRATVGDSPTGAIIEGADYIAVRSCFCRCGKCPHYTTD